MTAAKAQPLALLSPRSSRVQQISNSLSRTSKLYFEGGTLKRRWGHFPLSLPHNLRERVGHVKQFPDDFLNPGVIPHHSACEAKTGLLSGVLGGLSPEGSVAWGVPRGCFLVNVQEKCQSLAPI